MFYLKSFVKNISKNVFLYIFGEIKPSNYSADSFRRLEKCLRSKQLFQNQGKIFILHENGYFLSEHENGKLNSCFYVRKMMFKALFSQNFGIYSLRVKTKRTHLPEKSGRKEIGMLFRIYVCRSQTLQAWTCKNKIK